MQPRPETREGDVRHRLGIGTANRVLGSVCFTFFKCGFSRPSLSARPFYEKVSWRVNKILRFFFGRTAPGLSTGVFIGLQLLAVRRLVVEEPVTKHRSRKNVILILATYGGDPHAAYRVARFLQDHYERFSLYVFGFCKSAGTLLALGANNIVMGDRAEFGPLDVQIHKPDEFMHRVSGLDITKALASISTSAWDAFEEFFINMRARSGGVITTKTASESAAQVINGLFSPITGESSN